MNFIPLIPNYNLFTIIIFSRRILISIKSFLNFWSAAIFRVFFGFKNISFDNPFDFCVFDSRIKSPNNNHGKDNERQQGENSVINSFSGGEFSGWCRRSNNHKQQKRPVSASLIHQSIDGGQLEKDSVPLLWAAHYDKWKRRTSGPFIGKSADGFLSRKSEMSATEWTSEWKVETQ